MKKSILNILITILICYSGLVVFMTLSQDKFLFYPTVNRSFDEKRIPNLKNISFIENDQSYEGYVLNEDKAGHGVVIYFGGNAEDVTSAIVEYSFINSQAICFFNYRGYGKNSGKPSQDVIFKDAELILNKIKKNYGENNISLIGRSLGSGVATYLASKYKIKKLVLVTPYDSILNVAKEHYSFLPVRWILNHPFRSDLYVKNIEIPVLVFMAVKDRVIPNNRTKALLQNFSNKPSLIVLNDANHNNVTYWPEFKKSLKTFLD
jgi:uncharacterized protein